MNRRYIEFYIIMGIVTSAILIILVGKYYFGWFETGTTNYARYKPVMKNIENPKVPESSSPEKLSEPDIASLNESVAKHNKISDQPEADNKKIEKVVYTKNKSQVSQVKTSNSEVTGKSIEVKKIHIPVEPVSIKTNFNEEKRIVLNEQNFHSLGEFVSGDEKDYRYNLINKLSVNTIVIDKLSKGNGVSHEFFKVAYQTNMIPAKVLIDIVESKEFRDLIPKPILKRESAIQLSIGEKVVFSASAIKNLLILWGEGKLTPVQKVWIVGAEK